MIGDEPAIGRVQNAEALHVELIGEIARGAVVNGDPVTKVLPVFRDDVLGEEFDCVIRDRLEHPHSGEAFSVNKDVGVNGVGFGYRHD